LQTGRNTPSPESNQDRLPMACRLMDTDEGRTNFWSGRWESNPAPYAANLLNSQRGFLFFGTTWDQKRGQLFNCITVRSLDEMSVDTERHSRV